MQTVTEMDLPVLPVEEQEFAADPTPYVDAARKQHPWLAKFHAGYVIHGHQATKDLLNTDEKMRPFFDGVVEMFGAQGTGWADFMTSILPTVSGPTHDRLRSSVADAFTPRRAASTRPLMQTVISELLDEWAPKGEFDFAEFASFFPITVMCGLLGVSSDATRSLHDALETQVAAMSLNRDLLPKLLAGYETMFEFADSVVQQREAKGTSEEDLIGLLIDTKNSGKLDEKELRHMIIVLLLAGFDTTKNMLTMVSYLVIQHPGMWERCAEDALYCRSVVEEALRHSGILVPFRVVTHDIEYDGVRFPEGTMLCFALPLTGRDPAAFPDPNTFDPERTFTNRHFAFGRGDHVCLGQYLARVQIEEGLHLIAQRLANPRITGAVERRPFLGAGGLRTLPIAFDPAPARPVEETAA